MNLEKDTFGLVLSVRGAATYYNTSMLTISKDRSTLIKGIVIVMMVFLHLFNKSNTDLCTNLLYIGGEPFAKWRNLSILSLVYELGKGPADFNDTLPRQARG